MHEQDRFRDPLVSLYELAAEDIFVVCPRCGHRAVSAAQHTVGGWAWSEPRRLTCARCAYVASWCPGPSSISCWGGPVDPYFQLPLWLRAECCGGRTLWAFNPTHLDLLENYVASQLRERGSESDGMTLVARLPLWLKSAKNRDEVLHTIRRLRASIDGQPEKPAITL